MFLSVSSEAPRFATFARVASFWMLSTWAKMLARTRQCTSVATKRKNAAIPFAAFYVVAVQAARSYLRARSRSFVLIVFHSGLVSPAISP